MLSAAGGNDDDEQREVDPGSHPLRLWTPSCPQQSRWELVHVLPGRRLDLRKVPTEVADHVGALEVGRKPLQRAGSLAAWAGEARNQLLASVSQFLSGRCRHASHLALLHHDAPVTHGAPLNVGR